MVVVKDGPGKERLAPTSLSCPGLPVLGPRSIWLALGGLLLLHLTNPLAWGSSRPALWFPPAGIGLVLVAWFGPRAALLVLVDGLLLILQGVLLGWLPNPAAIPSGVGLAAADVVLAAGAGPVAWSFYHRRGRGARSLGDPRSAMLFLFLVPGL